MKIFSDPKTTVKPSFRYAVLVLAIMLVACERTAAPQVERPPATKPAAELNSPGVTALPSDEAATLVAIRFLEDRVRLDPEDFGAQNKLAGYYLKRLRETGNLGFLERASAAAQASLASVPVAGNAEGLAALTQAEHAAHDFTAARDHALQLVQLAPGKSYPFELLGDALIELGDYARAQTAFQEMQNRTGNSINVETRLARHAVLHGKTEIARQHFTNALTQALGTSPPPRETVAWCHWQLGETAFSAGEYETAATHYRAALTVVPDYPQALASLGRILAGQGNLPAAIESYQRAIGISPDPAFIAALGDLFSLGGEENKAAAQYILVEKIGQLAALNGATVNRQLALFHADHDLKPQEAYANAAEEYVLRQDIYGADALAWTAFKAGKLTEAQAAIKQALRLGTQDAKLFYHAGMIASGAGDEQAARAYLTRALTLSPQFDPLQAPIAKQTLQDLTLGKRSNAALP